MRARRECLPNFGTGTLAIARHSLKDDAGTSSDRESRTGADSSTVVDPRGGRIEPAGGAE